MLSLRLKRRAHDAGLDAGSGAATAAAASSATDLPQASAKQTHRYTQHSGVEAAREICNVLMDIPVQSVRKLVADLTSQNRIAPWPGGPLGDVSSASKRALCTHMGRQLRTSLADASRTSSAQQLCDAPLTHGSIGQLRALLSHHQGQPSGDSERVLLTGAQIQRLTKGELCRALAQHASLSDMDAEWIPSSDALQRQLDSASEDILAVQPPPPGGVVPRRFVDPTSSRLMMHPQTISIDEDSTLQLIEWINRGNNAFAPNKPLQEDIDEWLRAYWGVSLADLRVSANRFSEWAFVRTLGKGQYGEVSLYRHRKTGKQIAIKVVNAQYADQEDVMREIDVLESFKHACHKYLVCFDRVFPEVPGNDSYFSMEYLDGYVALHELRRADLSAAQVVKLCLNMVYGLRYMHGHRVVHNDIHGNNIMVLPHTQEIKYIDFGMARMRIAGRLTDAYTDNDWLAVHGQISNLINSPLTMDEVRGLQSLMRSTDVSWDSEIKSMLKRQPQVARA